MNGSVGWLLVSIEPNKRGENAPCPNSCQEFKAMLSPMHFHLLTLCLNHHPFLPKGLSFLGSLSLYLILTLFNPPKGSDTESRRTYSNFFKNTCLGYSKLPPQQEDNSPTLHCDRGQWALASTVPISSPASLEPLVTSQRSVLY